MLIFLFSKIKLILIMWLSGQCGEPAPGKRDHNNAVMHIFDMPKYLSTIIIVYDISQTIIYTLSRFGID